MADALALVAVLFLLFWALPWLLVESGLGPLAGVMLIVWVVGSWISRFAPPERGTDYRDRW